MLLLNNNPIDFFIFPGGEYQIKLPPTLSSERVILMWKPTEASEIPFLALIINALNNMGAYDIDLDILYLPYARQDRVCAPGEALSLKVICKFLDNLNLSVIRIWDVHNVLQTGLFFNKTMIKFISPTHIFNRFNILNDFDLSNLVICAPDIGAFDRVRDLCDMLNMRLPIMLSKVRCPNSGRVILINYSSNNYDCSGYNVLIIDDICDGGATFNQAAECLKNQGASNLYLYVTHGIFSKGLDLLKQNFKHIYCHHVLHDDRFISDDKLTILQEYPIAT